MAPNLHQIVSSAHNSVPMVSFQGKTSTNAAKMINFPFLWVQDNLTLKHKNTENPRKTAENRQKLVDDQI
jgi:hypothetical protein